MIILNQQRKVPIERREFELFTEGLLSIVPEAFAKDLSVVFISDRRMNELNKFFRGKDATTDVLSFPHKADEFEPDSNNLGDIVISVEQAKKQAEENGLTLENEIRQLILHGLLHLCGYDHETDGGEMNAREMEIRETLKI